MPSCWGFVHRPGATRVSSASAKKAKRGDARLGTKDARKYGSAWLARPRWEYGQLQLVALQTRLYRSVVYKGSVPSPLKMITDVRSLNNFKTIDPHHDYGILRILINSKTIDPHQISRILRIQSNGGKNEANSV